ncbi:hypothetical protein GCM10007868_23180 [Gluconobacter frateurii]|uniref:Uncharacterized protein n=1 Tax=Gluconobacter frateurii NRIC 0228 TaxID=1307946 RepID=A0ABQ0Q7M8_9PROT|nr:hypothetical protein AA0228_0190 [Gluconobacter frateurii NRIC 0228]GLP91243.1 hypothetical protein GCM10007868_23180 [Gluconobacter frateurii]
METLRCLRSPQVLARDGVDDDAVPDFFDGIADRNGGNHARMGFQRLYDILNHFRWYAGARTIMNQHKIRWLRQVGERFQPVPHAVVTFCTARNGWQNLQPGKAFGQQGIVSDWQKNIYMRKEGFGSTADDGFAPQHPELLAGTFTLG